MGDNVTLAGQHVALSAMELTDAEGDLRVTPTVVVWANCAPLFEAGLPVGCDEDGLLHLHVVAAAMRGTAARLTLCSGDQVDSVQRDEFEVEVPLTMLALLAPLSSVIPFHLFLFDGKAPRRPEFVRLNVQDAAAAVDLTSTSVVTDLLEVSDAHPALRSLTQLTGEAGDNAEAFRNARHVLYPLLAGLALGQYPSWNGLTSLCSVHASAVEDKDASVSDKAQAMLIIDVLQAVLRTSQQAVDAHGVDLNWGRLPDGLKPLAEQFSQVQTQLVSELVQRPDTLPVLAIQQGRFLAAVRAVAFILARRVWAMYDHHRTDGVRPSWLLAEWMTLDSEDDEPWWALPGMVQPLAFHDSVILRDLLSVRPHGFEDNTPGPLLANCLHEGVGGALYLLQGHGLDLSEVLDGLSRADVKPANFADVRVVVETMWNGEERYTAGGQHQCALCSGVEDMTHYSWDVERLASAVSATIAMLADFDAVVHDLVIGEEVWRNHRLAFLGRLMTSIRDGALGAA